MKELKSKIEALLFCTPEGIETRKLAKLCGIGSVGHVKSCLKEMQEDYKKEGRGLKITEESGLWKFAVRDRHLELVKEAAKPEMEKSVLETLAYIAHRGKILQSTVVKVRSNKAYEHLKILEEQGFIERKPRGSTKQVKLTKRFYDYFKLKEGETLELPEG